MHATAFVSSWIAPNQHNFNNTSQTRCPAHLSPSMTLLSHEKIDVLSTSMGTQVAKYKFEIEIPAKFSKDRRRQSIQSMKQHANFPGFRKGSLPPYVMKELEQFVLRDSCNDMIDQVLRELDLSRLDGDEGEPEVDYDQLSSTFTSGEDFIFTCEMQAKQIITETPAEDLEDIVTTDVELEKVEMFKDPEKEGAAA